MIIFRDAAAAAICLSLVAMIGAILLDLVGHGSLSYSLWLGAVTAGGFGLGRLARRD